MRVELLVRSYNQMMGLARYTECLCAALTDHSIDYSLVSPACPSPVTCAHSLLAPLGLDVRTFFTTYPIAAPLSRRGLKHLTAQQMAILLWFNPHLRPSVVTVHDIVPFLVRHQEDQSTFRHPLDQLFDGLAMQGLRRADALISVSEFTKQTLIENLGCQEDKVFVVHEGVDRDMFHPLSPTEDFLCRHQLDRSSRYVLYVGSENPRKNLPRLLEALTLVRERLPSVKLIKIGSPQYLPHAERLRERIKELGLSEAVLWCEHVSDQDLAQFYNVGDVFAFPSRYEGFGLPLLEAMACGTPVVCSNAASLPEVVGDAAIMVPPQDAQGLADALYEVLTEQKLRDELRRKGLRRVRRFTWERRARQTVAVYRKVWRSFCQNT